MSQKPTREQALKLRSRVKNRKPTFRRQESWRYKRVSQVWRRPDGIDSKMRRKVKGWPVQAEVGYRGPRKTRGLHPSGLEEVLVRNVDDLAHVDPGRHVVLIARTVGMKKRADIYVRAGERSIHILNPLPEEKPAEEEEKEEAVEGAEEKETGAKAETEDELEKESGKESKT